MLYAALVALAVMGLLYGGKSFVEGWQERNLRRELGMAELKFKEDELRSNREGLTELNEQKQAMATMTMNQANTARDIDYRRQLEMMRETQMGERANQQFAMMMNSRDNDTAMKLQLIQSLMGSAADRGPTRPGERIPITRLIGLGD